LPEAEEYQIDGRVSSGGTVRVTVVAQGHGGGAFGRLWRDAGRGFWQMWSGECAGQWTAVRRG